MEYLYCPNDNFEDFSSGRVLYGGKGIPNFPVRLLNEIYGRARSHLEKKEGIVLYDPCCGGGYALTVLGLFHNSDIDRIYASDVDADMVAAAQKNLSLLTYDGLEKRQQEIVRMYQEYKKEAHADALKSCDRIKNMLHKEIEVEVCRADCTKALPQIYPDIILTDVPYGNLVEWQGGETLSVDRMLERLWEISHPQTILAVCMDKKQRIENRNWKRIEKQTIGKRKFEILKKQGAS